MAWSEEHATLCEDSERSSISRGNTSSFRRFIWQKGLFCDSSAINFAPPARTSSCSELSSGCIIANPPIL